MEERSGQTRPRSVPVGHGNRRLADIPDCGDALGFRPPPGGAIDCEPYPSDSDSEFGTPTEEQRMLHEEAQWRRLQERSTKQMHEKLDSLREAFLDGVDSPVGPEVLRYALDWIGSDSSLSESDGRGGQSLERFAAAGDETLPPCDEEQQSFHGIDERQQGRNYHMAYYGHQGYAQSRGSLMSSESQGLQSQCSIEERQPLQTRSLPGFPN